MARTCVHIYESAVAASAAPKTRLPRPVPRPPASSSCESSSSSALEHYAVVVESNWEGLWGCWRHKIITKAGPRFGRSLGDWVGKTLHSIWFFWIGVWGLGPWVWYISASPSWNLCVCHWAQSLSVFKLIWWASWLAGWLANCTALHCWTWSIWVSEQDLVAHINAKTEMLQQQITARMTRPPRLQCARFADFWHNRADRQAGLRRDGRTGQLLGSWAESD